MNITAGIYKGRKIIAPDENITRPTLSKTRMGVFNTLYSLLGDFNGKSFLDVFGGSGIMGLEAFSRGFEYVQVFELNKKSAEIIKKNYQILGLTPNLTIGDSTKLVKRLNKVFDVVYIDPPYKSGLYEDVLENIKGNIIVLESSENIDITNYEIIKKKEFSSSILTFLKGKN